MWFWFLVLAARSLAWLGRALDRLGAADSFPGMRPCFIKAAEKAMLHARQPDLEEREPQTGFVTIRLSMTGMILYVREPGEPVAMSEAHPKEPWLFIDKTATGRIVGLRILHSDLVDWDVWHRRELVKDLPPHLVRAVHHFVFGRESGPV